VDDAAQGVERLIAILETGTVDERVGAVQSMPIWHDETRRMASEALMEVLQRDSAPEVRALAAERLGLSQDPHAVGLLLAELADPDVRVRRGASHGLHNLACVHPVADKQAVDQLHDAVDDPDLLIRYHAVGAFGYLQDDRVADTLFAAFADDNIDMCQQAVQSLGQQGLLPPADALFENLRGRFDRRGRIAVLQAARPYFSDSDVEMLALRLGDVDEGVQEMASGTLRQWQRSFPALIAQMEISAPRERRLILVLLAELGFPAAVTKKDDIYATVVAALLNGASDANDVIRAEAVERLGALVSERADARPFLEQIDGGPPLTPDGGGPFRTQVVDTLFDALADPSPPVRRAAVWSLSFLKVTRAVDHIRALLDDPDATVRAHAIDALHDYYITSSDGQRVTVPLQGVLRDSDAMVRRHALCALRPWMIVEAAVAQQPLSVLPMPAAQHGAISLPALARQAIEAALAVMRDDPQHDLASSRRQAIYESFGSPLDLAANRARGLLSLWTVRRLIHHPSLTDCFRLPDVVEEIETIEDVLTEMLIPSAAVYRLSSDMQGGWFAPEFDGYPINYAIAASHEALRRIASSEIIAYNGLDSYAVVMHGISADGNSFYQGFSLDREDNRADPAHWTSLALAWTAHHDGEYEYGDGEDVYDPVARRAFWEWWLTEAVPAAWADRQRARS